MYYVDPFPTRDWDLKLRQTASTFASTSVWFCWTMLTLLGLANGFNTSSTFDSTTPEALYSVPGFSHDWHCGYGLVTMDTDMDTSLGSLRNHDGYGDENVTLNNKIELSWLLHDDSILFILCNMGEVSYNRIGSYGFEVRREKKIHFSLFVVKTSKLVISSCFFDECRREMYKYACRTRSTITFSSFSQ